MGEVDSQRTVGGARQRAELEPMAITRKALEVRRV